MRLGPRPPGAQRSELIAAAIAKGWEALAGWDGLGQRAPTAPGPHSMWNSTRWPMTLSIPSINAQYCWTAKGGHAFCAEPPPGHAQDLAQRGMRRCPIGVCA
jgi:hypothetical protein